MQNKCVAFGDYLNHFSKKNTTILHSAFSILHLRVSALNWSLQKRKEGGKALLLYFLLEIRMPALMSRNASKYCSFEKQ